MTIARHFVSLRTYALAFAVALSPAPLQVSCDPGNIDLSSLELEVGGQNLVQGFDTALRSYDVSTDGSAAAATLRATSLAGNSDVSWQWWVGGAIVDSGPIGIGGGEVPLLDIPPEGLSQLRVVVKAGAPSTRQGYYRVNLSRQDVFACTEQGILDAIAMGGGPHTFDCVGPTTVVTTDTIVIDNDVILDGEGNMTVDGNHHTFDISSGVTAELHGFTVASNGCEITCPPPWIDPFCCRLGYGISNEGTLTVANSTVAGIAGTGFLNYGTLAVINSTTSNSLFGILGPGTVTVTNGTVSGNGEVGIAGFGTVTVTNSTVSGNMGPGIEGFAALTLTNSTVSGNSGFGVYSESSVGTATVINSTVSGNGDGGMLIFGTATVTNTIIDGECASVATISLGYNIESPGNTCGFDQSTDQVDVTAVELNLGPLQYNGGPTETHALLPGSFAIDVIPPEMCEVETDQRGVTRPQGTMCDVGAFEYVSSGGCCGWGR